MLAQNFNRRTNGAMEHNTLCCGIPNALRRNNPYNDLQSAEYYKTILKQIKDEWESEWVDDEHVKDR